MSVSDGDPAGVTRLLPDAPVRMARSADPLAFVWADLDATAARLPALLQGEAERTPLLVTGAWGSGKTTLMRLVQAELEGAPGLPADPTRTVWFDAWAHVGQAGLLVALCRSVWDQAPAFRTQDEADRTRLRNLMKAAIAATLGFASSAAATAATLSGMPWAAPMLSWLDPGRIGKTLLATSKDVEASPVPPEPPLRALANRLRAVLHLGWGEGEERRIPPGREPVLFVDDLDRCPPDEALRLLDQVRTLLELGLPCRVVFGVDRAILHQAVQHRFRALPDYDGNRYLEKVFPLSVDVGGPARADMDRFVRGLVGWLAQHNAAAAGIAAHTDDLVEVLQEPAFANPRLVKRCLNRFALVVAWSEALPGPAADVVLWIAAGERWPRLRELARKHPDREWWMGFLESDGGTPEVAAFFAQPGARHFLYDRMLKDPPRVQRLLDIDTALRRLGL